jgi:cytochrome c oxidase cbb3-type subunit 2
MSGEQHGNFFYNIEKSAIITIIGIILLFSGAVTVTLIAPSLVDPSWTQPISNYQVQMYEVADPNIFISSALKSGGELQFVYHISEGNSLLAFKESATVRIVAPPELKPFVTEANDPILKLTSKLLLIRDPQSASKDGDFDGSKEAEALRKDLQAAWKTAHANDEHKDEIKPDFAIFELFLPDSHEAFALAPTDAQTENWIDRNFKVLDSKQMQPWHNEKGVIYIPNPQEYRIARYTTFTGSEAWRYDPNGELIRDMAELKGHALGFRSRKELIAYGEHLYAIEGCWYCHTDQTRTLIQDVVLNGSDSFPAPPSSANEYIYQEITFPGTRRIGPDISRVGVKRPSRDWHKAHFWSPKTASRGSIMPSFQHFFDYDPRGTARSISGVPNYKFEAIFQYLMTKGTRITPPTQAWWLGLDPINTKAIIEGKKKLP